MKWPEVPLSKVAVINPGRPRNLGIRDDQPVSFVPMPAVSEQSAAIEHPDLRPYIDVKKGFTYFEENDILFAKITPFMENGKSAIATGLVDGIGFGSTEFHVIRPNQSLLLPKYVHYFVKQQSFRDNAKARMRGAVGQQRVPKEFLDDTMIPLPSISEQRRIVEILDQADRLRKLRADADAKAQHIPPALFIKMFGDPATNPKGWQQKTLAQTGSKVRYGLGQPPEKASDGVPLIRATNIKQGFISKEEMIYVNPNSVPSTRNAFLDANEVLVVRSGACTGDAAQVTEEWKGSVVGYDLVITPSENLRAGFIESYLLTPYIQKNYFFAHKSRAGQPHLNANQLENTPFYVPLIDRQDKYKSMISGLRKLRKERTNSEKQIQKIFQVILHRSFTGDLTASWREAHMEELFQEMELQGKSLAP
ncbi:MAG: restriction endonuclease subunit S [Desulfobacterales bacterium]|jgi:type I restriction enzyme S subunit